MSINELVHRDMEAGLYLKNFGVPMVVDGVPLVVDDRDEGVGESSGREGASVRVRTMYWLASKLSKPKPRQRMVVSGEEWIVAKAENLSGMIKVQLYREVS